MLHTKPSWFVVSCVVSFASFVMLGGCSRADHEEDQHKVWLGYTLREPHLTPTYPEFASSRAEATARVRRWNSKELSDPEAELERRFFVAMADLLDGYLMTAMHAFDSLERDGYSRARLLSRLALLNAQTTSSNTEVLMAHALGSDFFKNELTADEMLLLIDAETKSGYAPVRFANAIFNYQLPTKIAESQRFQDGLDRLLRTQFAGRVIDEQIWFQRAPDRPFVVAWSLSESEIEQLDSQPDRLDSWLVKLQVFSSPDHLDDEKLLYYLPIGPELLGREGDRYSRSWMARVVSEALAAAQATPDDLVADLLDAFEIRDHRTGMLDLAVVEARFGNNAAATDVLVNLINDSIVHGVDELPSAAADAKPDLVYLLSAVYVIYPDFDGLVDSRFGAEIAVAFARALERTSWHVAR